MVMTSSVEMIWVEMNIIKVSLRSEHDSNPNF